MYPCLGRKAPLERLPIDQKVAGSVPGQGMYKNDSCPGNCLLLQQGLDGTNLGTPLLSNYAPPSFLITTFETSSASETSQHCFCFCFFYLDSSLPNNHELPNSKELIHQGGGCRQTPSQHASVGASYTYLSLGFYFNCDDVPLQGMGHF